MLQKQVRRLTRKARVKSQIHGTAAKPRLSVFKSSTNIYAQLIDDDAGKTLCSASDLKIEKGTRIEKAKKVWENIAKLATDAKISDVVFDRGGFLYHGRIKTLADAAREAGLTF